MRAPRRLGGAGPRTPCDEADLLQKVMLSELYTGRQSIEESVSLGLIARSYECAADHAVELARHLTFFLTEDRLMARIDDR